MGEIGRLSLGFRDKAKILADIVDTVQDWRVSAKRNK